ncbi:MAG: hypothetical protein Q8O62_12580 [Aequorivita sp.]|nr:hypothetical protein [Aequorivita sp.]
MAFTFPVFNTERSDNDNSTFSESSFNAIFAWTSLVHIAKEQSISVVYLHTINLLPKQ